MNLVNDVMCIPAPRNAEVLEEFHRFHLGTAPDKLPSALQPRYFCFAFSFFSCYVLWYYCRHLYVLFNLTVKLQRRLGIEQIDRSLGFVHVASDWGSEVLRSVRAVMS